MAIQSTNPFEVVTLDQWQEGLNQQAPRGSISDQNQWWNENLFPVGPGALRSCWGPGPAIYTAPAGAQILRIFFGYIGNETPQFSAPPPGRLGWMFLSDGTIDQVDLDTGDVTHVGSASVLYYDYESSDTAPGSGVANQSTDFTKLAVSNVDKSGTDRTAFFHSMTAGETIKVNGVTWTVTLVTPASGVTTFSLSPAEAAPPYGISRISFNSTGPAVQVWEPIAPQYWADAVVWRPQFFGNIAGQQGGVLFGSPKGLYAWDGAILSKPGDAAPDWLTDAQESVPVAYTMPIGLPGIYTMEVYNSRLFVSGKDVISFSAPSNGADFSATDGGGSIGYFGDKLTYTYNDLAASTGYMFVFGDSSTDIIADVQLTGDGSAAIPFVTNLNYSNIDPQVGQRFPRPVGRVGRYMQVFNGAGIFECQGGQQREIGARVTNIFSTLDTSQFLPTMAPATMFGFRVLLVNGMFTDPFGVKRNLQLMWHPTQPEFWSVASQNLTLTNIGYYEQDSILTPYGTDGTSLYQLFARPDPALRKRLSTKFFRGAGPKQLVIKNWKRIFLEFSDVAGTGVSFTGTLTTQGGGVPGGVKDIGFELSPGAGYAFEPQPTEGMGIAGAIDLESTSPDFICERLHVGYEDRTLYGV
jgi:hypothetical protein